MKPTSRIAFAMIVIAFFSINSIAQRQTKLYIDDGNGNFTTLQSSPGGGTLTLPAGNGVLSLGAGGVTLQGTPPLFQETGSINLSGDIIAGSSLTSGGTITANNVGGGTIIIDPTGAGTGNLIELDAAGATTTDIQGTGNNWDVDKSGNGVFNSLFAFTYYTNTNNVFGNSNMQNYEFCEIEGQNNTFVALPLPAAGEIAAVKFRDANPAHVMTVTTQGGASIDGSSSITLNGYGGTHPSGITCVCDGDNWFIIGSH